MIKHSNEINRRKFHEKRLTTDFIIDKPGSVKCQLLQVYVMACNTACNKKTCDLWKLPNSAFKLGKNT